MQPLEQQKISTHAQFLERIEQQSEFSVQVSWLSEQLDEIYKLALAEVRKPISVPEVFSVWESMVAICDFFLDQVTALHSRYPDCPINPAKISHLRLKAMENMELHRC
mgnify:CR=1 FL=1